MSRIYVCRPFLLCTLMLLLVCHFRCKLLCDLSICFQSQISIPEIIPTAEFSFVFALMMAY